MSSIKIVLADADGLTLTDTETAELEEFLEEFLAPFVGQADEECCRLEFILIAGKNYNKNGYFIYSEIRQAINEYRLDAIQASVARIVNLQEEYELAKAREEESKPSEISSWKMPPRI